MLNDSGQSREKMAKNGLIFLPAWGAGHLIPMLEMAKKLHHRFSITVLLIKPPSQSFTASATSYIQSISSSGLDIHFQHLPSVEPPQETQSIEDFVSLYIQSHKPHIKSAISDHLSSAPVAALFIDFFATTIIDVANELRIPSYIYYTSTAASLLLTLHLPTLEEKIPVDFEEFQSDIEIPGVSAIPPTSMPTALMIKKSRSYIWFKYHGQRFREAKGIILNTFAELEPKPIQALAENSNSNSIPPIYPVGPVLLVGNANSAQHPCIEWLNLQPSASVVFLCFGSMGCFTGPQAMEMASALERCGHRFLWCLRSPSAEGLLPTDTNLDGVLPEGFLERTRGRGMVWPTWVPQAEILAHRAVGGFVTHCGWNSCLESLWFGVPMIGWPLYAEQHLNAFEMARELGVALEIKLDRGNGGFVSSEELERGVRCLMGGSEEGKKVRGMAEAMKIASRKAVGDGGSSNSYLERLVEDLERCM